jgi:hypothetical protein
VTSAAQPSGQRPCPRALRHRRFPEHGQGRVPEAGCIHALHSPAGAPVRRRGPERRGPTRERHPAGLADRAHRPPISAFISADTRPISRGRPARKKRRDRPNRETEQNRARFRAIYLGGQDRSRATPLQGHACTLSPPTYFRIRATCCGCHGRPDRVAMPSASSAFAMRVTA